MIQVNKNKKRPRPFSLVKCKTCFQKGQREKMIGEAFKPGVRAARQKRTRIKKALRGEGFSYK